MLPTVYIFCYLPAVPLWCRKPQQGVAEFSCFFGCYHGKSQRCAFPFDNMQPLRCNSKRLICFFSFTAKNFYTTPPCTQFVQPLGVFCVNLAKLQCRCGKTFFAMSAVQERKTTNFTQRQSCTQFVQSLGIFCQFGKIAMQMRKNFVCNVCSAREKNYKFLHNISRVRNLCNRWVSFVSIWQNCNADAEKFCLQCLQCKREKPQNPPFRAFICVKSTHLTVNMV